MSLHARITHRQSRQQVHPGILYRPITRRGARIPCTNGAWTAVKTEYGTWVFTWEGGAGPYEIWLEGRLLDTVTALEYEYEYEGYDDAPPPLEIVCETDPENELYPPHAILQWREVDGASFYIVEKYVTDKWVAKHTAKHTDVGYHTYKTPALEDQTQTKYRVTALNAKGHTGTPVSFTFQIIRNPAPPDVEYEIDESNDLVVSAAT